MAAEAPTFLEEAREQANAVTAPVIAPRTQVPSEREQARGAVTEFSALELPPEPPAKSWRQHLRSYLSSVDPRPAFAQSPYRGTPILILLIVGAMTGLEGNVQGTFGPQIRADLNFDLTYLLVIGQVVGFITLPLGFWFGYLCDRYPRVWFLRVGLYLGQAAAIVTALTYTPLVYGGSQLLGAVGGQAAAAPGASLVADYYGPSVRTRAYAFSGIGSAFSGLIGLLLITILAAVLSWRAALIGFTIVGSIAGLLFFKLREPVRGELDRLAMGASAEAAAVPQRPLGLQEGIRAVLAVKTVRRLLYLSPFTTAAGAGLLLVLPFYYNSKFHATVSQLALTSALGIAVSIVASIFSAPISDRIMARDPGRVYLFTAATTALGAVNVVVLVIAPNLLVASLVGIVPGFIAGVTAPANLAVGSLVVPARIRAFTAQVQRAVAYLGTPLSFGIISMTEHSGFELALLIFIPVTLAAAVLQLTVRPCVAADIRAALASNLADEEARRARARGTNKMLIIRDVDVTYDGVQVLFNVDLDVEEGECLALLGTNGAGKSTLLRAISGIEQASNGAIYFDGDDITHAPPHQNAPRGIVMIPGGRAIFPALTVEENIKTATYLYQDDHEYIRTRTAEVYSWFPVLTERAKQLAGNLSGGEQQMLSLAQAFLMKPRLLMIDELSLGLAPRVIELLLDIIRRINAEGTTVILVEQSVNLSLAIAKRAVYMEKGEIRFDGATAELMTQSDIVRSVFLGAAQQTSTLGGSGRRYLPIEEQQRLLEVRGLTVSFGGVNAVTGVDLNIEEGEIVGVIGPNGAGKSTLSDAISGFIMPPDVTGGTIAFKGQDISLMPPHRRARLGVSRSFQNVRLFPQMTVRENIALAFEKRIRVRSVVLAALWMPQVRADEKRVTRRVDNLIEALGLTDYQDKFLAELSTGSRRIVDLACQLAAGPALLLLDEPSAGLAQAEAEELRSLLPRIRRELGCAMLVVEHDVPLITAVSDRLVVMELGKVIADGPPEEVANDPRVNQAYLGASAEVLARSGVFAGGKGSGS